MIDNVLDYPFLFGGQKHAIADYTHTHTQPQSLNHVKKKALLHALFNFI